MLAAVALLGIGAAVTAAAWEDRVYFEVDASAADFNVQGRIALDGDDWSGWEEADSEQIALSVELTNLAPNDSRTVKLQLRNVGDITAYVAGQGGTWDSNHAACDPAFSIDPEDPYLTVAAGAESGVYDLTFTTDAWADCEGYEGTFTFVAVASTDQPDTP